MNLELITSSLVGWVKTVMTLYQVSVPVLQSHQNAPAPKGNYIVVEYAGNPTKLGTFYREDSEIAAGKAPIRNDYSLDFKVREVGGDGSLLLKLSQSTNLNLIIDYLESKKLSLVGTQKIITMPYQNDENWVRESLLEVTVTISIETDNPVYAIETVEITNNIE